MAAAHTTQRLQNEFLSCPRCTNPFKDPKALPCLHNMCKACLQAHIDQEMEGGRRTSFACPVCRTKIFVPDPGKATGAWASQFPSNFVIRGMLDAIAAGSPDLAAPPGVAPGRHPLEAGGGGGGGRGGGGGAGVGHHHPSRDRGSPTSSSPAPVPASHQHHERMARMERSSGSTGSRGSSQSSVDLESNPEVSEVWHKLCQLRSSVQAEEMDVMSSLTSLTRQRDDQERAMTDTVDKLQEIITMRKTELLENLSTCFNDEVEKLRQRVQSCKDHTQSLKSCEDLLRSMTSLPAGSDSVSELLESVNLQLEETLYRPRPENPSRVVLDYDAASVYKVTEALASFGVVRVEKVASTDAQRPTPSAAQQQPSSNRTSAAQQQQPGSRPQAHHHHQAGSAGTSQGSGDDSNAGLPAYEAVAKVPGSSPPVLMEKITPGQLTPDGQGTQIYDIAVTSGGTVVMTVYGEKMVQAFRAIRIQGGRKSRSFLGRVQLDSEPRCLCTVSQNYVAVVGDMRVYLLSVTNDRLELKRTIPAAKNYTGISAYGGDTLVVSCQNPVSVDFLGMTGFITETIDKDRATGQALFKAPNFLATSGKDGLLFVSDGAKLLCVNNAGKVKYVFPKPDGEPLTNAEGVCCDPAGFVYLVDRGKRRVLALSARGTRIADVLTTEHGLSDPCAVALDEQGLLYVTNDFMEILVFKVC